MKQLIDTLNLYLGKKMPQLPVALKEFIVKVSPYLVIIGMLACIPAVLALAGLSAMIAKYAAAYPNYGATWGYYGVVAGVGSIISIVLNFMALPGLFKPSPQGWTMVFYSFLVGVIECCMLFAFPSIIGIAIGAYILFQIRPYYFGEATLTIEAESQTPPTTPPSQTPPTPPQA